MYMYKNTEALARYRFRSRDSQKFGREARNYWQVLEEIKSSLVAGCWAINLSRWSRRKHHWSPGARLTNKRNLATLANSKLPTVFSSSRIHNPITRSHRPTRRQVFTNFHLNFSAPESPKSMQFFFLHFDDYFPNFQTLQWDKNFEKFTNFVHIFWKRREICFLQFFPTISISKK